MVTCPCEWWPRYMGDKTKEFITADSVTLLVLEPQALQIGSELIFHRQALFSGIPLDSCGTIPVVANHHSGDALTRIAICHFRQTHCRARL